MQTPNQVRLLNPASTPISCRAGGLTDPRQGATIPPGITPYRAKAPKDGGIWPVLMGCAILRDDEE